MLAALALPRVLESVRDRVVVLTGGAVLVVGLAGGLLASSFLAVIALWGVLGIGYSLAQTPSGRLLRRSSTVEDRPALFAAQFALSHACWLFTYPLAGWLGSRAGIPVAFMTLGLIAVAALAIALQVWPSSDPAEIEHSHDDLPRDDPHLLAVPPTGRQPRHRHAFVIDSHHPKWPRTR